MIIKISKCCILLLVVVLLFLSLSCNNDHPLNPSLEKSLVLAGDNRPELEKVLKRYGETEKDDLKYEAACFLIENMKDCHYYDGANLDGYLEYYKLLYENRKSGLPPDELSQIIRNKHGRLSTLIPYLDLQTLDSAFICRHIDHAFMVWRSVPWGKNVSFADFCEYILPYRIGTERPELWRDDYYNEYFDLVAPLFDPANRNSDDPVEAVKRLMKKAAVREETYFTTTVPEDLPHIGPTVAKYKSGSCRELTDFAIYLCRAFCIPAHIDFMPVRGGESVRHFWISYEDKHGELWTQDFPGSIRSVTRYGLDGKGASKVFRQTFGSNPDIIETLRKNNIEESAVSEFTNVKTRDVTNRYATNLSDVFLVPTDILYKGASPGVVFLCNSFYFDWLPVDIAKIEDGKIVLSNINKGAVMRFATLSGKTVTPVSDPFFVSPGDNSLHFFDTEGGITDITLFSKFETDTENSHRDRMFGGVFEGSDDPDFRRRDTLLVIDKMPLRLFIEGRTNNNSKYRYVRYFGREGTHCNIAEAAFYEYVTDTLPLKGKITGTPGSRNENDPHSHTNVFDGRTDTSFDYSESSGGWTGLDLGTPRSISKIVFTPRNRDNYIRPGYTYELFYCDGDWRTAGIMTANSDSLVFKNVPSTALFYLECHTGGRQERIFSYENGKQIWR